MEDQARIDAEHLRLLVIFHYVVASAMAFFACIPILHVVVGAAMILHKFPADKSGGPPYLMGWIFLLGGGTFVIFGWSLAVATLFAARSLTRRRRYLYCLVIAGIMAAMFMPLGTALGAFTIIVLMRPTVKEMFGAAAAA